MFATGEICGVFDDVLETHPSGDELSFNIFPCQSGLGFELLGDAAISLDRNLATYVKNPPGTFHLEGLRIAAGRSRAISGID
jgi:hypothetical protein